MNKTTVDLWKEYYLQNQSQTNFYPENFVARIFNSNLPVKYLDHDFKNKLILDIGCGHGRNIPFLKNLGFKVSGIEISHDQISHLKKKFLDCDFYYGTSSSSPFQNDYFDYILACNSIYYLNSKQENIEDNFSECHRVLKKNGFFIFSVVGYKHSVLKDALRLDNNNFVIQGNNRGIDNEMLIRPLLKNEHIQSLTKDLFKILKSGEIYESSEGFNRHLYYYVSSAI